MQGMIRCALVPLWGFALAGLLCACHTTDTAAPDAAAGAGLTVKWTTKSQGWPASLDSGVTLETATFALDSLRVIGDAGPGDPRTTARSVDVKWSDSGGPEDIAFANAPTGLYSQLALQIDGNDVDDSFTLTGTVEVNGNTEDFKIEDMSAVPLMLQIDKSLSPGVSSTIDIRIDFDHALSSVDWESLPTTDGTIELDNNSSSELRDFRKKLLESFSTPNITAHE